VELYRVITKLCAIGLKFVMFYLKHLIASVVLEYELKMTHTVSADEDVKCVSLGEIVSRRA